MHELGKMLYMIWIFSIFGLLCFGGITIYSLWLLVKFIIGLF